MSKTALGIAALTLAAIAFTGCSGSGSRRSTTTAPIGSNSALDISPTSSALAGGTEGVAYTATFNATGGSGTGYTWDISGTVPPGLSGFPGTGPQVVLSGTPLVPGPYSFTVVLQDSAGASTNRTYTVDIQPAPPVFPPDTWDVVPNIFFAPSSRSGHTAVWTGTEMIVWGGEDGTQTSLGDGGAWDFTAGWRQVSNTGAPSPRVRHTAVWTGTEMIVWGGRLTGIGPGFLNTGGAYDPVTDTWRTLSTTGAPQARDLHTAVWTGTRMIVYGGQGDFGPGPRPNSVDMVFADGAAYDPATDTWAPIAASTSVGVEARRAHTALWTGNRMVVWGGRNSFALTIQPINTGGVYDPATNAWTATQSQIGTPAARTAHTAVWTGTDMIVWAGANTGGFLPQGTDSGGVYNVASDTWSGTLTANVPTARFDHVAVWTGSEMVAWGGGTANGVTDTGGAYDPVTRTWRTISTTNAPTPRSGATAVWTGVRMIVWGGVDAAGQPVPNGAFYTP